MLRSTGVRALLGKPRTGSFWYLAAAMAIRAWMRRRRTTQTNEQTSTPLPGDVAARAGA